MKKEKLVESLCDKFGYVILLLRVMGVDENDVEDLATEVLIDALKSIDDLRDAEKLTPWIKTIAVNRASKYFGSRSKRKEISNMVRMEAGEIDIYDLVADEITVEKILQEAEENAMVEKLINSLSEAGRRIIRMRVWGDYKFREIADVMNLNVNTVKSVYPRSLKRLETNYSSLVEKEEDHG